jgi:hypothetical protein
MATDPEDVQAKEKDIQAQASSICQSVHDDFLLLVPEKGAQGRPTPRLPAQSRPLF